MRPPGQGQPGQMVPQQQQQQQAGGPPGAPGQKKNVLKFEGDYDFEQANTEFESLRSQLANIKMTATAAGQLPSSAMPPSIEQPSSLQQTLLPGV